MIQEMHERLKKANERRNCGADDEITRLRAANAELGGHIARMIGEISRADNALHDAGPDFVSGISCAEGIRTLIADRDKQITENKMLRRILARAIAEEACGADSEIYTVATECTEGKCWHSQARAALGGGGKKEEI